MYVIHLYVRIRNVQRNIENYNYINNSMNNRWMERMKRVKIANSKVHLMRMGSCVPAVSFGHI